MELLRKYWDSYKLNIVIKVSCILLLSLIFIFLQFNNIDDDIVRWDEQTNVNVILTTQMVRSNDFADISLKFQESKNNEIPEKQQKALTSLFYIHENEIKPFYEKPPLWYNLNIFYLKLKGYTPLNIDINDGDQAFESFSSLEDIEFDISRFDNRLQPRDFRVISVLSSTLLWFAMIIFGTKFLGFGNTLLALLLFLTTPFLFYKNPSSIFSSHNLNSADSDSTQLLFIFLSSVFFLIPLMCKKAVKRYTIIKWFYFGLAIAFSFTAFITKGIMGILPFLVFLTLAITLQIKILNPQKKNRFIIKKDIFIISTIIFLLLISFIGLNTLFYGESYYLQYISYHTINRALNVLEGHNEFILYHLLNLLNIRYAGISFVLILIMMALSIISCIRNDKKPLKHFLNRFFIYLLKDIKFQWLLTSTLLPLIIITLVQTKLAWYLLYLYPYICFLGGYIFMQKFKLKTKKTNFF